MANTPPNDIFQATEYVEIEPQTVLSVVAGSVKSDNLIAFQQEVVLQAQGEAVFIFDKMSALETAFLFASIYDIADELVMRTKDQQDYLIFDHQTRLMLRPRTVIDLIWREVLLMKEKSVYVGDFAIVKPEATIDLESLWEQSAQMAESENESNRIKAFLVLLFDELSPAITLTIKGTIPNLPLLFALYIVRSYGYNILFTDSAGGTITLFQANR